MAIIFNKLAGVMSAKGVTFYRLIKDGVLGKATVEKIKKNEGYVDTRTINNLCRYLSCQPGDIMAYQEKEGE